MTFNAKGYLIGTLFFMQLIAYGQSNWDKFRKLSPPLKKWVLLHPFKAKKALIVSNQVKKIADSMRTSPLLDGDGNGGQVDAFRHAFWMARLRQVIGKNAAKSLGEAHEKENYLTYKERKLEDGTVPDEIATIMDLFNNEVGLSLTYKNCKTPLNGLVYQIINLVHQGKLKIIKKNTKGRFLTCQNALIQPKSLIGKWKNNKCLIQSNIIPTQ